MENSFKDEDRQKLIDFLNFIASKAEFKMSTQEVIKYFGLLNHIQKVILPKINDHILEIKKVVEDESNSKE